VNAAEEGEVASGLLPFTVNGELRLVPELKWRANRAWQAEVQATYARLADLPADSAEGAAAMLDAQRELILAYDTTGALGDLEDATETELDAIYKKLLEVSYPLSQSWMAVQLTIVKGLRQAAASLPASSTNGPSPTGISAARSSSSGSRTAKSSSSTRRRRSA
jgi:hypothetical protein